MSNFEDIPFTPVHSERDQPWDFFGRTDAKAETPVLWPPHAKGWLIGEDFDAGRDWGQEEKGTTEDEMAGWHHWLDGRESEWTLGVGDGQGGLACCNSWGHKESDTTEQLNWMLLGFLVERSCLEETSSQRKMQRSTFSEKNVTIKWENSKWKTDKAKRRWQIRHLQVDMSFQDWNLRTS